MPHKKTLLILFSLLAPLFCFGQHQDSIRAREGLRFGINLSYARPADASLLHLAPSIMLRFKRHGLLIGPAIKFFLGPKLNGIQVAYQYYTFHLAKILDFSFQYDGHIAME